MNATNQHWTIRRRVTNDWHQRVSMYALGQRIPRPAFPAGMIVEIEIRHVRKRDPDNVAKVLLDALVAARILVDDCFPHLVETRLRARPAKTNETVIIVRATE